jgi:hypothetical protein
MDAPPTPAGPFQVLDCTLSSIATGVRVQNLRELSDHVATTPAGCLFFHFWGTLLRPRFEVTAFRNDFADWAARGLNDLVLAERLALVDPADHPAADDLRRAVLEVLEERLDEREHVPWAPGDRLFHFIRAQVVVFDTGRRIAHPGELSAVLPSLSVGSIFYHVVDARRRLPDNIDDFSRWLQASGPDFDGPRKRLATVNPYFLTLTELRQRLHALLSETPDGRAP